MQEILSSRTAIKLGPCCMYFLLPEEGSQQSSQNPSDHDRPLSGPALEAAQLHQQAVQADYSRQQRLIAQHQSTQDASKSDSSSVAASHQENNQSTPASSTLRSRGVPPHAVTGKSYVELTMDAFESEELREISQRLGGLTSAEITGWAVAQYPDVFTSAEPRKALSTGVQGVLARRGEKGPIAPGKKGARWNLRESGAVKKRKVDSIDGSGAKNIEKKDESERQIHQYINEFEDDAGSGGEYMPNYRYRGRNSFDSHNASYQDSNV